MIHEEWHSLGWECPRCHTIWSPFVKECKCVLAGSRRKDVVIDDDDDIGHGKPYKYNGPAPLIRFNTLRVLRRD